MNIQDYMNNPLGKGNAVFMIHEAKRYLDEQYRILNGRMRLTWYKLHDKYYVAHVRIPSRTAQNLFYDVLVEFNMDNVPAGTSVINNASARVFSNCPSFTYTYANAFDATGDLIPWSKVKYAKEIFTKDPVKRNPYKIKAYERSVYLAIKYILSNGRNLVRHIDQRSIKVTSHSKILLHVYKASEIEGMYHSRTKKVSSKNDAGKKKQKTPKTMEKEGVKKKTLVGKSNNVKTTKKTSTTKKTKTSRRI